MLLNTLKLKFLISTVLLVAMLSMLGCNVGESKSNTQVASNSNSTFNPDETICNTECYKNTNEDGSFELSGISHCTGSVPVAFTPQSLDVCNVVFETTE